MLHGVHLCNEVLMFLSFEFLAMIISLDTLFYIFCAFAFMGLNFSVRFLIFKRGVS